MKNKFSIVIPVYQNGVNLDETIPEFIEFLNTLDANKYNSELVFVNDGSTDNSQELLEKYHLLHPEIIKVIMLTKNFGQSAATIAGLKYATGDVIGMISADMQDPVELFVKMLKDWENGTRLVIATRKSRNDGIISDFFSNMYYNIVAGLVSKDYPKGGFDFCLMDRVVLNQFLKMEQKTSGWLLTIFNFGYEYTLHYYDRKERSKGKSQYNFWKKVLILYDSLLANTYVPIRMVTAVGFITSLSGFMYALYIIVSWFFNPDIDSSPEGWATIVILVSIFSGLILIALGIIGEYIWRIYLEVRKGPIYIISRIFDGNDAK
jgi:dolichol-phosphate mannosyltransferase